MQRIIQRLNRRGSTRTGITLVELLVVVTILSVLTAIMIPRLRTINKDRNIREAARIVGSTFSKASQRAFTEDGAGVLLERHPNFTSPDGVRYAVTTMYVLRNLPPYTGDDENSTANVMGTTVTIPMPLEHDASATPPRLIVQPNDYISLNYSSVRYRILSATPAGANMNLVLDTSGYLPNPPSGTNIPFVIYRQPRKLESSRVELPEGYLVDLRFSGQTTVGVAATAGTVCNQAVDPSFGNPGAASEIRVLFNRDGGIDRLYFYDLLNSAAPGAIIAARPTGSLYLFVAAYEIDESINPIEQPSNLWVTVNDTTGGVNVGYSVPPTGTLDVDGDGDVGTPADRILEARSIAATQQSALQ